MNWIWLTDVGRLTSAIDLSSPCGDVADDLGREAKRYGGRAFYVARSNPAFAAVEKRFAVPDSRVHVIDTDGDPRLPAPRSVDCVVFAASQGWEKRLPAAIDGMDGVARFAAEFLRPGGWLVCFLENPALALKTRPRWRGARQALVGVTHLRKLSRAVRGQGFRDLRWYFGGPSIDAPVIMIPADRVAVSKWLEARDPTRHPLRHLRSRAATVLFPVRILMARR